ncbi:MAG: rhodanese-like domain-containing protein, partial [Sandaracinaceae bacterium]
ASFVGADACGLARTGDRPHPDHVVTGQPKRKGRAWTKAAVASSAFALLLALPLLVCGQRPASLRPAIEARYPAVRWVDVPRLAGWMADGDLALIDARQPEEFAVSHLRGARRVDPDAPDLDALGVSRDARVVVYCSVGWRSGGVADRMREAGFTDVYNLEGGIFAWANAGRPVFDGARRARQVHPYDEVWGRMLRAPLRAPLE